MNDIAAPPRTTADWQQLDRAHYLHPFTDHAALHRKGTRVITHAEGVYLYDSEGRQLLDGMARCCRDLTWAAVHKGDY